MTMVCVLKQAAPREQKLWHKSSPHLSYTPVHIHGPKPAGGMCHPHLVPKDAPALVYGGHNPEGWGSSMSTMGGRAKQGRGEGSEGSAKHSASRERAKACRAYKRREPEKQATYIVFCARSETIYQIMSHMARAPSRHEGTSFHNEKLRQRPSLDP